jgi:murein DD-endopeptidase MepM/ murein hydrolase activator NlpD
MRAFYAVMALVTASTFPSAPPQSTTPAIESAVTVDYRLPVRAPAAIVRAFEPPPTPYSAGHRGVDLRVRAGDVVWAAADGRVRFAGTVAARGVVVIEHGDGISTEYEPLEVDVHTGMLVRAGQMLGRVHGRHGDCAVDTCLHWGARRGSDYLDPMSLLTRLGPVRLLPWSEFTPADVPG